MENLSLKKKIAFFLSSIAPGFFLVGYNIGTGSVTTAASTGAKYGMMFIWPLLLLAPWFLADISNQSRDMKRTTNRLIALFTVSLGLVVPIFGGRSVLIMIISQALAAIATPVIVLLMLLLQNKEKIMGEHKATLKFNLIICFIFLFTVFMAITGIIGIKGLF